MRKTQPCTASRGRHRVAVTWSTRPDALLVHEASWSDSSRARSAPLGAPGVGRSLRAVSRGAGNATSASPARGGSGPHGGATCPQAEPARPHSEDSLSKPTGLRATPGGRAPGPATDLRTPGPVRPRRGGAENLRPPSSWRRGDVALAARPARAGGSAEPTWLRATPPCAPREAGLGPHRLQSGRPGPPGPRGRRRTWDEAFLSGPDAARGPGSEAHSCQLEG